MKKLFSTLIATAMIVSMTACGNEKKPSEPAPAPTEAVTEAPTEVETEAPTDAEVETETPAVHEQPEETPDNNKTDSNVSAEGTLGEILLADFTERAANEATTAQEIADGLMTNPAILFGPVTMPVEQGLLTGFGNAEITGFKEGVTFAPMIGSIAFVGYVFDLEEGTDAAAFMQTLKDNADPRWNICVEAEETICEQVGNKVFFVMCPKSLEG
ncbi:MAG: hypothetical protein IKK66_04195 [Ruminococcus sp.]|nr:hypothetical protein [Ruminococcus sp.]